MGRANAGSIRFVYRWWAHLVTAAAVTLCLSATGHAQSEEHPFTFDVSAGVSPLVGSISQRLENGWNFKFGGGYNFNSHFATTVEYSYSGFGVSRAVLSQAHVPDGNSHLWSITADPKLRLVPVRNFDPYIVGGVGYYRRTVEFTRPTAVPVLFVDPFFGVFFNTLVAADQVLGDITQGGIGGSLGGGFDVKLPSSGLKFFTEARYHYADTGRIPTRMVPVTFGIRW